MRYISMFSGIEAASVAWRGMGWNPVAFAEIEPFPSAVLAHHYPSVPNVGNITAVDWSQYNGKADLVVGGPPCQAFSVAGLRRSLDDDRGNLSLAYVRAVNAIDPEWVITENVPGWLSTGDNAFGCFLAAMVGADTPLVPSRESGGRWTDAGVVTGPRRTATWRILDAQYIRVDSHPRAVPQRSPAALLPVGESLSGHPAPRREAGERVAPTVSSGAPFSSTGNERVEAEALVARGADGFGTDFDCDGGLIPFIAGCLNSAGGHAVPGNSIQDADQGYLLPARAPTAYPQPGDPLAVRRLTPRECCRLQGFPDDYLDILYRGKPAADGPRYKALGNSMACNVMSWIGRRIAMVNALDLFSGAAA